MDQHLPDTITKTPINDADINANSQDRPNNSHGDNTARTSKQLKPYKVILIILIILACAVSFVKISHLNQIKDAESFIPPNSPTLFVRPSPIPSSASISSTPTPTITNNSTHNTISPVIFPSSTPAKSVPKDIYFAFDGVIYRDENCNGVRDNNEGVVNPSATINVFDVPSNTIYVTMNSGGGTFSYAGYIKANETLTLRPIVVSPPGYKSNPNTDHQQFTFTKSSVHASFSIPQVPAEFVGSCFPH